MPPSFSLDLMLTDSALERIGHARYWMESQDGRQIRRHLIAAVQIVGELRSTLNVREGDPLVANLDDLCDYMSRQLEAANRHNRLETLDEVSDLLREVRTAWAFTSPCSRKHPCMTARIQ